MRLSNDLREFLESLNSRDIDYVIVGAHSLAFHARPRYTGDLDILVRATPENAAKVVDLLNHFGRRRRLQGIRLHQTRAVDSTGSSAEPN